MQDLWLLRIIELTRRRPLDVPQRESLPGSKPLGEAQAHTGKDGCVGCTRRVAVLERQHTLSLLMDRAEAGHCLFVAGELYGTAAFGQKQRFSRLTAHALEPSRLEPAALHGIVPILIMRGSPRRACVAVCGSRGELQDSPLSSLKHSRSILGASEGIPADLQLRYERWVLETTLRRGVSVALWFIGISSILLLVLDIPASITAGAPKEARWLLTWRITALACFLGLFLVLKRSQHAGSVSSRVATGEAYALVIAILVGLTSNQVLTQYFIQDVSLYGAGMVSVAAALHVPSRGRIAVFVGTWFLLICGLWLVHGHYGHRVPTGLIVNATGILAATLMIDRLVASYLRSAFMHEVLLERDKERITKLLDEVSEHRAELARWNTELSDRVEASVAEVQRLSHLKRFFSPAVSSLILAGEVDPLKTRRKEITVVYLDLRGFTAFTESAEPEEVLAVLRDYHQTMGRLVVSFNGTVEHFAGDGIMIFFNDPVELTDPGDQAIAMAVEMQRQFDRCAARWRARGHVLGLGIGIAQGYATIGAIGFEGRLDYGAVGAVCNMAARISSEAASGQILVQERVITSAARTFVSEECAPLTLKGIPRPVPVRNVIAKQVPGVAAA